VTLRSSVTAIPFKKDEWGMVSDSDFVTARYGDIAALAKAGRFRHLEIKGGVDLAKDFPEIMAVLGSPLATVRIEESQTVVVTKK